MIVYKIKWKSYVADLYMPDSDVCSVVLLLPGLPKSSNSEKIIKTFLSTGSAVLYPNFSGMFDSGGEFDGMNCIKDVQEFIELARQPEVVELYFNKKIKLNNGKEVILVGMSFGSTVALLAFNERVNKLILLSPVLLFNQKEINEIVDFDFKKQMDSLLYLLKNAFPYTYRIKSSDIFKSFLYGNIDILRRNNIERVINDLKIKTLIVHGKLDSSVPWKISESIRQTTNNKMIEWKFFNVAHSTSSYNKSVLNKIADFVKY